MCDALDHQAFFPKPFDSYIPFMVLPQICLEGITSTVTQKVKELKETVKGEWLKGFQG